MDVAERFNKLLSSISPTEAQLKDGTTKHAGALHGSTHYDLPGPLRWFTANIGIHHVHHLASRIPSYRLAEVLRDHPALRETGRLTLRQSLACFRLALWDEEKRRLVSFRGLRAPAGAWAPRGTERSDATARDATGGRIAAT